MSRIVKDIKDTATGELIYLKGHAGATYMNDGSTVEDNINVLLTTNKNSSVPKVNASATTMTIMPNTFYVWGSVSTLDITLGPETDGVLNEYMFQFTSSDPATTLMLPESIKWIGGIPEIVTNTTYQCSIIHNIAVICGV